MRCPSCGHDNRAGAKFCDNCGLRLDGASIPASPAISDELPPEERRVVTAVFCDIVGSTAAAETMDPEDWREVMNGAFDRMTGPIDQYGGTVARLMGDAILALFGAPTAHEDDPERAVRAGLAIIGEMAPYAEKVKQTLGIDIGVRVGINTGLAMVGRVGSAAHAEYTAMGDAINVAARMEQTADPGTVQAGGATRAAAEHAFTWEPLGGVAVKGKSEPVASWRALGLASGAQAVARRPLVGRDEELEMLLGRLHRAAGGARATIVVRGEPGVGKTRLLDAAQELSGELPWHRVAAASWESEVPYAFLRELTTELLASQASPALASQPPEVRRPLERLLSSTGGADDESFAGAVGQAFAALAASIGPLVLVGEDLHWADDASIEALEAVTNSGDGVAVVLTVRTHASEAFERLLGGVVQELAEIRLAPLSADAVDALLADSAPELGVDDRAALVDRANGNPLFALELAGAIEGGVAGGELPDNLVSLLVASADKLPDEVRRLANVAAALGPTVPGNLLDLAIPEGVELLVAHGVMIDAGTTVSFRHALLQEAIYSTIPHRDRAKLHGRVAHDIEQGAEEPDEFADLLATQFHLADDARASHYEIVAGDRARSLGAGARAIELLERACHRVADLSSLASDELVVLATALGRAYELESRFADAQQHYEDLLARAEEVGDERAVLAITTSLASLLLLSISSSGDVDRGSALAESALTLAEQLDEQAIRARLLWNMSRARLLNGHDAQGSWEFTELGLQVAEAAGDEEILAYLRNDAYMPLTSLGRVDEAIRFTRMARDDWAGLGVRNMYADAVMVEGAIAKCLGELNQAQSRFAHAREVADEINNTWVRTVVDFNDTMLAPFQGRWRDWYELAAPILGLERYDPPLNFYGEGVSRGLAYLGQPDRVVERQAVFRASMVGDVERFLAGTSMFEALGLAMTGQVSRAREVLSGTREQDLFFDGPIWATNAFVWLEATVLLDLADGEHAAAERAVGEISTLMAKYPLFPRMAAVLRAEIAAAAGRPDASLWEEAIEPLVGEAHWWVARGLSGWSRMPGYEHRAAEAGDIVVRCLDGLPADYVASASTVDWVAHVMM